MAEYERELARRALAPIVENPVDAPGWTDLGTVTATPAASTRFGWWIAPAVAIAVLLIGSVGLLSARALLTDPPSPDPSTSPSIASWDDDRIEGSRSDWNTGLALTVEPSVWIDRVEGLCSVPLTIADVSAYADDSVASDVSHGRVLTTIDAADEARLGIYAIQILWELALDVCVEEPLNEAQSWSVISWVNQTGLWPSPAWPDRFSLLCAVDDAGDDPYRPLAAQFIAEDVAADLAFASPDWVPDEDQATIALELMARSPAPLPVCVTTSTVPRVDSIGSEPSAISTVISPSWVTGDIEDHGEIIDTVLRGGDLPELSESIVQIVIDNLHDGGWTPYLYQQQIANDLTISENVSVRLGNNDSLGVMWRFRLSDTPDLNERTPNDAEWPSGWKVWTRTDEQRGLIIFSAGHPNLPLEAEIVFFADPREWPEVRAEDQPILRTTLEDAESLGASILNSVVEVIPIPSETQ